jgi:tetratricopeptide (TPR) repeat protein
MGRQRSRKRKHFFLYFTGTLAVIIVLAGCQHQNVLLPQYHMIHRAEESMAAGNFYAALAANDRAKRALYKTVGDRILLQRGIIHAHPDNPDQDYRQAMTCFNVVLEEFPESSLKDEVTIWRAFVEHMIAQEYAHDYYADKSHFLALMLAEQDASIEGIQTRLRYEKYRLKKSKKRVQELESQIDELKKIDLGIELKKRESAP